MIVLCITASIFLVQVVGAFIAVALALLAPFAYEWLTPTDRQDVGDLLSSLDSDVRDAARTLDLRDELTETYFASQLEDLAELADQSRSMVVVKPYEPAIEQLRDRYVGLAKDFADTAEAAALTYRDADARRRSRAALGALTRQIGEELGAP